MLNLDQRVANYFAQTGRSGYYIEQLTPRQRRRALHKANRRSDAAVVRREGRAQARADRREAAKARRAGLTPNR